MSLAKREGLVAKAPRAGINRNEIILALIALVQTVLLALIGTGQVRISGTGEKSALEQQLLPAVSGDGIELKQTSRLGAEDCLRGSQRALLANGFRLGARSDRTITVNQGDIAVSVRCRVDAIVVSAAAPNGSIAEGAVARIRSAIREELSGDVRVE